MGVSTDGQICFGIAFEECTEFPWDSEEYDGDIDAWWLSLSSFSILVITLVLLIFIGEALRETFDPRKN